MAAEVVAKVLTIAMDEESDGYVVQFWVGQELADRPTLNEAFALLGSMDSLQREVYSFLVQWEDGEFTMEPDEELSECLAIFDKYDSGDELGPPLDRQWKTGQMAEAIVTHLVNANVFGVWRTYDPDLIDPDADDTDADTEGEGEGEGDAATPAPVEDGAADDPDNDEPPLESEV